MRDFFIRKISEFTLFFITSIIIEMITFLFIFGSPFSSYPLLEIMIFFIISLPIFFVNNRQFDIAYYTIAMFVVVFFSLVNINFYCIFGDIFSLHNFTLIKNNGLGVFSVSFLNFESIILLVLLYAAFIVALVYVSKIKYVKMPKKVKKKMPGLKREFNYNHFGLVTSFIALSIGIYSLTFNAIVKEEKRYDDELIVDAVTITKNRNYNKYGMFSYYIRELQYFNYDVEKVNIENLQKYFKSEQDTTNYSDYTGLLKDKNVFTIMIETGAEMMVNEYLTPNLYSLLKEGVNCSNNVSKNKTNISEMIGITGSSISSGIKEEIDYVLPFSLPNMLDDNYTSYFFHDTGGEGINNMDIYNRKKKIPEYGFDKVYFHEDIYPDRDIWGWNGSYILDSETMPFVAQTLLKEDDPFYAFYTSLSMHGPYFDSDNEELLKEKYYQKLLNAKNKNLWQNPLENDKYGNDKGIDLFMLACMDFDAGLGDIINQFKQAGKYDDTLFVIYGDHDIYYNGLDNRSLNYSLSGYEELTHYDMYKTVMCFSNPLLNDKFHQSREEYSEFSSPYNIVPTIMHLLGIDYNSRMYMGNSLFSNDENIFYSIELSSFFNDEYWTDNGKTIFTSFVEKNESKEKQFLELVDKLIKKQARIDMLYNQNIFANYDFNEFNN